MQVFGIFEGGGAEGLAHVGAIAAARELGVQFVGVAGASAGAIVASLVAVGYNANALYDPLKRSGLLSIALTDLFGPGKWDEWKQFSAALQNKLSTTTPLGTWFRAPFFYRDWKKPITRLMTELGFFDTAPLEQAIDQWLRGGVISIPESQERLLFSDLDATKVPPLRIIASDIDAQVPIVFSREKTPEIPVARAVCASIAIPFFLKPVTLEVDGERRTLVDGGLVSNFPVWIFEEARRKRGGPTATIGFRLSEVTDALSMVKALPSVLRGNCSRPRLTQTLKFMPEASTICTPYGSMLTPRPTTSICRPNEGTRSIKVRGSKRGSCSFAMWRRAIRRC